MSGRLWLSFWDICLRNLPEGHFAHRCLTGQEARVLIEQAREDTRLVCVTNHDLFAPYKKRHADQHKELCAVLGEHFGIALSLRDFVTATEEEGEPLYSAAPLQGVEVQGEDRLLIVDCAYAVPEKRDDSILNTRVSVETVTFHLLADTER
jgi:hypothetical protein